MSSWVSLVKQLPGAALGFSCAFDVMAGVEAEDPAVVMARDDDEERCTAVWLEGRPAGAVESDV
jgi:hypothetical protein